MKTKRSTKGSQDQSAPHTQSDDKGNTSNEGNSTRPEEMSRKETLQHVLYAANSAIDLCQSACPKRAKGEPVLTSLGALTVVLQSPDHPVPVSEENNYSILLRNEFGVIVWDGPRTVLNVQWDSGSNYTVVVFEPGDWMETLNNAAHPDGGSDSNV